ncbi:MAG: 4-hydroxy-tetrahydrodipicolinate reductase [Paraglaciecola sp.]|jgi:4-hydroxy-tetrahydrodipicolinate reductase
MKIAILGYGKMGKTIEQMSTKKGHEVVLRIGINNLADFNEKNVQKADVVIEFSNPESAFDNLSKCLEWGVPVVSGTTGWLDKMEEIKSICNKNKGAFFYASNYSVGVNIFFAINRQLAKMMNEQPQYEVEVEEIHHTQKLDAPSGTAITLAQGIVQEMSRKTNWVKEKIEKSTDLPIISKRIDKVPGTHEIVYNSPIDSIEIKHTAHSRAGFAGGAILAAEWIVGKEGNFGMGDMLGF